MLMLIEWLQRGKTLLPASQVWTSYFGSHSCKKWWYYHFKEGKTIIQHFGQYISWPFVSSRFYCDIDLNLAGGPGPVACNRMYFRSVLPRKL